MSSQSRDNAVTPGQSVSRSNLPAPQVQDFRSALRDAMREKDDQGRAWGSAQWGVYAFFDYDGEPIYVGQTNEKLSGRVGRHLTNQRTDAVAMRILDPFEVAEVELWPLWDLQGRRDAPAKAILNAAEHAAYRQAIANSRFKAILNEKVPPGGQTFELPASRRFMLASPEVRAERGHPDVRIARRAENLARLAAVAHERGSVTNGLRRVLVIQAVRLAYLSAVRLAVAEGRPEPDPDAISMEALIGPMIFGPDDDTDELD